MKGNRLIASSIALALVLSLGSVAVPALAAAPKKSLEVSGWLPYWRKASSTADALAHLGAFTEINPFGYSVKADGTLHDTLNISQAPWPELIAAAKAKKIRVIPTVMWSDGEAIHRILSNTKTRIALEDEIAALVKQKGFDGIDIDFEGKKVETKAYFATFLKGLYQRMGNKWVMCDIEARTPLSSRYDGTPPAAASIYANDYVAIGKYCDRVRIMAYDQGTVDVKLNRAAGGSPYIPIADPQWVEKVITLAAETIPKRKLVIGIPTYGYEYKVTPTAAGYRYDRQWAFNPKYAFDLMAKFQPNVTRNLAGELSFTYVPSGASMPNPATTDPALGIGTTSLSGTVGGETASPYNIVWWSDAKAIEDKINLAKKLGVRGVAIFKIDGGEDPGLWDALKKI